MFGVNLAQGFYIGDFFVRYYGILIASGMGAAYWLMMRLGRQRNISSEVIESVFIWSAVWGIIGARIYHVVDYWRYYMQFPEEIVMIWQGGLGIYGAIAGGLVGMAIGARRNKILLIDAMNISAPGLMLAQAIGRIGNWTNLEGFGGPTQLPWKLYVPPTLRPESLVVFDYFHPTFIYEAVLCLVGFLILMILYKKGYGNLLAGSYLVLYGLIRLITERFRLDTAMWGGIAVADVFSIVLIISGIWLLRRHSNQASVKIR